MNKFADQLKIYVAYTDDDWKRNNNFRLSIKRKKISHPENK